ncbi:MAG: hypothetical protein HPY69_18730 [Armatimonadetes bacterium]|nr:hypothetical protein [Armatimonadota bacterium]
MGPAERWMGTALFGFTGGFGIYLVTTRWMALALRRRLLRGGARAQAVVVEREATRERRATRSYWATLEFALPDGRRQQARCETSHRFYQFHPRGSTTSLRYWPETPDAVAIEGDEPLSAKRRAQIVMGVVFASAAIVLIVRQWG